MNVVHKIIRVFGLMICDKMDVWESIMEVRLMLELFLDLGQPFGGDMGRHYRIKNSSQ